ncbi:hypothetical protein BJX66DRAFT_315006 [Aspergillus keveii]|uniref:GST N-terminal domain-containing protein n=1 Tax=Aspergillus keveii TaxID=714993 RepID=A0ABR4FQ91_9EURO
MTELPDCHLIGTYTRYSGWTARVEAVLEYFQIPYTAQIIPFQDVRTVSPTSLVPVVQSRCLANIHISDSLAICEFLAETNPSLPLWPRDPRLRAMARSAAAQMHSGFSVLRNNFGTNFVARYTGNIPVSEKAKEEISYALTIWNSARKATKARLAELNEADEGFLFGGFSIADAFFWPVLWRIRTYDLPLNGASMDALMWIETMWNDPSIRKLIHNYYTQAKDPKTRIEHYDDIFRGRDDIQFGTFPEDWTFHAHRYS